MPRGSPQFSSFFSVRFLVLSLFRSGNSNQVQAGKSWLKFVTRMGQPREGEPYGGGPQGGQTVGGKTLVVPPFVHLLSVSFIYFQTLVYTWAYNKEVPFVYI